LDCGPWALTITPRSEILAVTYSAYVLFMITVPIASLAGTLIFIETAGIQIFKSRFERFLVGKFVHFQ
jgi:hypothetical protein